MLASANLFGAFAFAKAFSSLLPALSLITMQLSGNRAIFQLDGRRLPARARALLVERDLAALVQCMHEVSGGSGAVLGIDVDYDAHFDDAWFHHFGVAPRRSAMTRCVLDVAFLSAPVPQADPVVETNARTQCLALMTERSAPGTVINQVLDRLWSCAPDLPGLEDLAGALLTTGRTLRRRLSEEGTTFRVLTDQVQFTTAQQLLGTDQMAVQQIAQHLGYSDTSAFTHAFRRWSGTNPRSYRDRLESST